MPTNLPLPVTAPFSRAQRATLMNLVSRAATAEIMPRFRRLDSGDIGTKSGPTDLVTEADIAAEAMIARGLQIAFPNALVVGEESLEKTPDYREDLAKAELGFLIDPVDGTWNFAHGLPVFGTMVAATRFGRPVFALIHDPVGQDTIWADNDTASTWVPRTGLPRTLAGKEKPELGDTIGFLELSFMDRKHRMEASLQCMDLAQTTGLKCSAHQYRLLAQGAVDFYMATKLNPWDHAAGVLLCQQAGGHAAMLDGSPYDTSKNSGYLLCAGSKDTWDMLAEHFKGLL